MFRVSSSGLLRVGLVWARQHHFATGETYFSADVPVHALWLVQAGELEVTTSREVWSVRAGQVFFARPCKARRIEARSEARWFTAGLQVTTPLGEDGLEHLAPGVFDLAPDATDRLRGLLHLANTMASWGGEPGIMAREGLVRALAAWLFADLGEGALRTAVVPPWLRGALAHIETHPEVNVEALAQSAHFSPAQFRRLFARHLGTTPSQFLANRRLELARGHLEFGDEPMERVAHLSGFGGPAQFSREFKRKYGLSPLQWRRAALESL